MALLQCEFKSQTLGIACSLNAILPEETALSKLVGDKRQVLYLLHGLSDNHTTWIRKTSIERYAEAYDVAIIMPAANRSFYANMHAGHRYWDFVSEELPRICQSLFPISSRREDTFVAGLSMGGYGAFKLALTYPERFAAAASLSGALALAQIEGEKDNLLPDWHSIFGPDEHFHDGPNDLIHLTKAFAKLPNPQRSALYLCCGTEDYLYPANQFFLQTCRKRGIELTYEEGPGDHNWAYWDAMIQRVLAWLPLRRRQINQQSST